MNKWLVLSIPALCLLAGLGWLVLRSEGGGPAQAALPASGGRRAAEPPVATEEVVAQPPATEIAAAPAPQEAATADKRRAVVGEEVPLEDGLRLLVVEAESARPLPGAEVWLLEDLALNENAWLTLDALMAGVPVHRTGADGTVLVSRPDKRFSLVARHGELFLASSGSRTRDEQTLELVPDHELRVRVSDPAGAPVADLPVLLDRRRNGWSSHSYERRTDDQGWARWPHVQLLLARTRSGNWSVGPRVTFEDLEPHPFALPPEGELVHEFVLPAWGSVLVDVLDEEGRPFRGRGEVQLGIVGEGEARRPSPFTHHQRSMVQAELSDSQVRFQHVQPGCELEVRAQRLGAMVPTHVFGEGPLVAGGEARFEVRLGADHPVLRATLLDETGKPVASMPVELRLQSSSSFNSSSDTLEAVTDEAGVLLVDLDVDWYEGNQRTLHITQADETGDRQATLDLSEKLEPGLHDKGPIVLGPPVVFVAGRVVDPSGRALGGISLSVSRQAEGQSYWQEVWGYPLTTDSEGRFVGDEPLVGSRFRIRADAGEVVGAPVEFQPGSANVLVIVDAAGAIAGSLIVDDEVPDDVMEIKVEPVAGDPEDLGLGWSDVRTDPDDEGAFAFEGLPPGLFTVAVSISGEREPLFSVEGVRVVARETNRPPDLQGIDLRGKVHHFELSIHSSEGDALQGNVRYGPAGAAELADRNWFRGESARFASRHPVVDVDVLAAGYEKVELRALSGDAEVELVAGQEVLLRLAGNVQLPEPPYYVKAVLVPVDGDAGPLGWRNPPFDERREIRVVVPASGSLRVQWMVERRQRNGSIATTVPMEPEQIVEVLEGVEGQSFDLDVDQEKMDALIGVFD